MKIIKLLMCILFLLCFNTTFSQKKEEKEKRSEISKTSDRVKQTSTETKEAVSTAKETLKDIGSIFKSKKIKEKETTTIILNNVDYGNANLSMLQKAIQKAKGVKKSTKKYQNNIATFSIEYKKSADELWQTLPINVTNKFNILSVEENSISISLKKQENKSNND
jgi:hypothetical protein